MRYSEKDLFNTLKNNPGIELDIDLDVGGKEPVQSGSQSALEERLLGEMMLVGLPEPEREYKFHKKRRWRFDFAWPDLKIAVEVQGGQWIHGGGRHQRGVHLDKEYEKLNAATILGWKVLLFTTTMVNDGTATSTIMDLLNHGHETS